MYKYILESIEQVNLLALVPLIIFFCFFTITTIVVLKKKKSFISKMKNLPLED